MKKFCSSCGNQLELSKRACSECGAANSFFIARFSLLEDPSDELEKLRLERGKIEKQIAEKEAAQIEFKRQEQLRKESFSTDPQLRNELLKLKAEIELYRNETVHLLNELRGELIEKIEEETRRTSAAVETAIKNRPEPEPKSYAVRGQRPAEPSRKSLVGNLIVILVFLFVIGIGGPGVYLYFNKPGEPRHEMVLPQLQQSIYKSPEAASGSPTGVNDGGAELRPATVAAEVSAKPSISSKEQFDLTVSRAMDDLIGQKLSGCDMVIQSVSEINNITQPVFIEKLPSGYLKYKFEVTIKRNNETHTSSPFVYYTSDGRFVKIDGADCK